MGTEAVNTHIAVAAAVISAGVAGLCAWILTIQTRIARVEEREAHLTSHMETFVSDLQDRFRAYEADVKAHAGNYAQIVAEMSFIRTTVGEIRQDFREFKDMAQRWRSQ